jgi:hypothetical protein
MKLQDRLPEGVTVDGKFYKMDFDFRNVLRMMDEMARKDLMQEAKEYRALKCLCRRPRNVQKVLAAVYAVLFDTAPKADGQKVTDFVQDAGLIRAAFMQSYGIDLYHDRLHWIAFRELIGALPEGSKYKEVIGIRARPIPAPTKWNGEERAWLMKAKAEVALRIDDEEERQEKYRRDVANVAAALLAWAEVKHG